MYAYNMFQISTVSQILFITLQDLYFIYTI